MNNSNLTVLYVCDNWPVCGAAFSVLGILGEMRKKGVNVVVAVNGKDYFYQRVKEMGVKVYVIPFSRMAVPNETSNIEISLRKLPRKIKKIYSDYQFEKMLAIEKIDIVHFSTVTIDGGFDVFHSNNIPIIWHIREFLEEDLNWRFRDHKKSIQQLESSDVIITVSNQVKEKYEKIVKNNNIKTIYNGIETTNYKTIKKLKNSDIYIGMIGTIKEEKGQIELLRAFTNLRFIDKKIHLIFVGKFDPVSIKYHSKLQKIVDKNNLCDVVEFRGQKTDIQSIWEDIDIAVVPSWVEAFGRVTVEAILAKCFVVGANTGGTKEILDYLDTGIQFKAKDVDDLSKKLRLAVVEISNSDINIDIPYEKALTTFSVSENANNIFDIYKKICTRGGGY